MLNVERLAHKETALGKEHRERLQRGYREAIQRGFREPVERVYKACREGMLSLYRERASTKTFVTRHMASNLAVFTRVGALLHVGLNVHLIGGCHTGMTQIVRHMFKRPRGDIL